MPKLPFSDADQIPDWAADLVGAAYSAGLVHGYTDGSFRPNEPITRLQWAVGQANIAQQINLLADEGAQRVMRSVANAVVQVDTDKAIGSGVVVSTAGHILTNYHVIKDASTVHVGWSSPMADHATYPPPSVGMPTGVMYTDPDRDLALLSPPWGREFAPITCASDCDEAIEVQEGQFGRHVWAQGSPLGLSGWVSPLTANGLTNIGGKRYIGLSGAINPGNSGGPLYDASGRLIGLVVAKLVDVTIEGIGLGIPLGDIVAFLRSHGVEPVMA